MIITPQRIPIVLIVIVIVEDKSMFLDDKLVKIDDIQSALDSKFDHASNKGVFGYRLKRVVLSLLMLFDPVFSEMRASGLTKVSVASQLANR